MNELTRQQAFALLLRPVRPNQLELGPSAATIEQRLRQTAEVYPFLTDAEKVKAEEWRFDVEIQLAAARKTMRQVVAAASHGR